MKSREEQVGQRHAAGHHACDHAGDPADDGADLAARLASEIGEVCDTQAGAQMLKLRQNAVDEPVEIAGHVLDEADDLVLQGRQDQQDRQHEDENEADADDGRRPDP